RRQRKRVRVQYYARALAHVRDATRLAGGRLLEHGTVRVTEQELRRTHVDGAVGGDELDRANGDAHDVRVGSQRCAVDRGGKRDAVGSREHVVDAGARPGRRIAARGENEQRHATDGESLQTRFTPSELRATRAVRSPRR